LPYFLGIASLIELRANSRTDDHDAQTTCCHLGDALCLACLLPVSAQPVGNGRMFDTLTDGVVQGINASSCDEFAARIQAARNQGSSGGGMKDRMKVMMAKNPEMRRQLINKLAGPIANKLFDCNLIPSF
jgi:hypothetical protein